MLLRAYAKQIQAPGLRQKFTSALGAKHIPAASADSAGRRLYLLKNRFAFEWRAIHCSDTCNKWLIAHLDNSSTRLKKRAN
jgi:hypothetical protein